MFCAAQSLVSIGLTDTTNPGSQQSRALRFFSAETRVWECTQSSLGTETGAWECTQSSLGTETRVWVHAVIARHWDRSLRVHSVIARHWDQSLRVHSVIARSTDNWQRNFEEHSSLYWKQKKNSILLWKAHVILFCPSFWLLSYFWRLTHHLRLVKRRPNH